MANRTKNTINPYAVLEVKANATADDVKAAYRRRAKATHPDIGGSSREFGDVKLAHAVLSDTERRERYDRTGDVEEPEPDNTEQGALERIAAMLKVVLEAEPDPNERDLVALMKAHLVSEVEAANSKLKVTRRSVQRAEQMRGRFRRKKLGDDPIKGILEWQISALKNAVDLVEAAIKQRERAVELLSDYDFANEISTGAFRVRRGVPPS
jgi:curved DNA-binding protein CbpA